MHLYLKDLLDRFNVGNATLYALLLVLAVLVSLRVEGFIRWSYGAVFLPLWVWNVLVAAGAISGIIVWLVKKSLRQDPENLYDFKALILSPLLQLPVFLTELLVAVNLDTGAHQWRAIFTPLYILPLVYIFPCIWGCFRKRNVDLEVVGMCSLLQVIFLGIKLDQVVQWKWGIVFIPTYLLLLAYLCGVCVYCGYLLFLPFSSSLSPQQLQTRRLADILRAACLVAVGLCVTVFVALLASRLDGHISLTYPAVFTPLFLTLILLLVSTITRRPANPWWFGVHKTFSSFVLDTCPILREYVNISIVPEDTASQTSNNSDDVRVKAKDKHKHKQSSLTIPSDVYPLEDLYAPD